MVHSLVTVPEDAPPATAMKLMEARRIHHLPVLDGARRLVGILTDRDLRRAVLNPALHERPEQLAGTLARLTVGEIMTLGVIAVRPETEVREAARIMYQRDIGALPVIDNGRVVGMVTSTDVMRALVSGGGGRR